MPEDARAELESLQKQLDALLKRRPEHCSGTEGFVGVHKASPELMGEIEDLEDKIAALKKTLGE